MGMVYNAITPSGTNTFRGDASYLFRRKDFSAFPFFFQGAARRRRARSRTRRWTPSPATLGGPIVKNKLFFYAGLRADPARPVGEEASSRSRRPTRPAIGLEPQPRRAAEHPDGEVLHRQGRLPAERRQPPDARATSASRTTRRTTTAWAGCGSMERRDRLPRRDGLDGRRSWSRRFGASLLNELRVQYAHRHQQSTANDGLGHRRRTSRSSGGGQLRRAVSARPARAATASTSSRTSGR